VLGNKRNLSREVNVQKIKQLKKSAVDQKIKLAFYFANIERRKKNKRNKHSI
jgi:hypothetical protein